MARGHHKTFPCNQAQIEVTFAWSGKTISSGMESDAFQKMGEHQCTGVGTERCPVGKKGELPGFGKCHFYQSLLGKDTSDAVM
jgi:hypothetical protein